MLYKAADILRRITQKESYFVRKILFVPDTSYELRHTSFGTAHGVSPLRQQLGSGFVGKIFFEPVGSVKIYQRPCFCDFNLSIMRSPRGTSRRFSSRTERSKSLLSSTLQENRFPVLRPARHGEQQLITVSSDKIGHSSLMSKSVTQSTRLAFANCKSFLKSALCGGFIAAPSMEFKLRIWHRFNNSTL